MTTHESLEHQEHVEHTASHGNKRAALLIAVLAAALAICEQQSKHAEIAVEENAVLAADAWNQYQAKSIRAAVAQDIARLGATLDPPAEPRLLLLRADVLKQLHADQIHYERGGKDGKKEIALRARHFEEVRQYSLERTHTFDNAAAALELGIVLSTASAITLSKLLIRFAGLMGVIGLVLGLLGFFAPGLLVF